MRSPMRELPSGTVTFLFTDIEGSTRLLEELGEGYGEALAEHRRRCARRSARTAASRSTTRATRSSSRSRRARGGRGRGRGQDALAAGPVRVRMGLHTGTPSRTDEGYFGRDVNLGARVAAAATAARSCSRKATRDLLDGEAMRDLGEHRVKDFDEPVWIYQLGDGALPAAEDDLEHEPPPPRVELRRPRAGGRRGRSAAPRVAARHAHRPGRLGEDAALDRGRRPSSSANSRTASSGSALATVHDPAVVLPAVAQTLGAQGDLAGHIGERETAARARQPRAGRRAPRRSWQRSSRRARTCRLLVTSRELLRVRGEVEYEVLPLADPDAVELFCLARRHRGERGGRGALPAPRQHAARARARRRPHEGAHARSRSSSGSASGSTSSRAAATPRSGRRRCARRSSGRTTCSRRKSSGSSPGSASSPAAARSTRPRRSPTPTSTRSSRSSRRASSATRTTASGCSRRSASTPSSGSTRRARRRRRSAGGYAEHFLAARRVGRPLRRGDRAGAVHRAWRSPPANGEPPCRARLGSRPRPGARLPPGSRAGAVLGHERPVRGRRAGSRRCSRAARMPRRLAQRRALRVLGGASYIAGDNERSAAASEEALELYRGSGTRRARRSMLFRLGTTYLDAGRPRSSAGRCSRRAWPASAGSANKMGECEAAGNLASIELE